MDWWVSNHYDKELALIDRVAATKKMTDFIKSKFDAVWFRGKTLYRILDGDQICVYDPSRIYEISQHMARFGEAGSKVRRKSDGMVGVIKARRDVTDILAAHPGAQLWLSPDTKYVYHVTWRKGGTDLNVQDKDVEPSRHQN